jgi:hypothetical protein
LAGETPPSFYCSASGEGVIDALPDVSIPRIFKTGVVALGIQAISLTKNLVVL